MHTPEALRQAILDNPRKRARDLADQLRVPEAALVAATVGHGATRITAAPDGLFPLVKPLGEIMALTRVPACVHEKIGWIEHYDVNGALARGPGIDLRLIPRHWVHAYAVENRSENGMRRSIQIFDAAGDAVHKIYPRDPSKIPAWDQMIGESTLPNQTDHQDFAPRDASDPPPNMPTGREIDPRGVDTILHAIRDAALPVTLIVGNRGCVQAHHGPLITLTPMGPWQNVMDPDFNLHLRRDKVASLRVSQPDDVSVLSAYTADQKPIFTVTVDSDTRPSERKAWETMLQGKLL